MRPNASAHDEKSGGMAVNGSAPAAAAGFYHGKVMHARLNPFGHRFDYNIFSLLIDIGDLKRADMLSRLFSVNRFNFMAFYERDHVDENHDRLDTYVRALLVNADLPEQPQRILLLCYPRIFGYVFNPISTYFVYGKDGHLIAAIYEVRNTFGHRHTYVARVEKGELSDAGLKQSRNKLLHVSPFIGMDAQYRFRVLPPGQNVRLRIMETENDKPLLSATFVGAFKPMTNTTIAKAIVQYPLMTLKIMLKIHWQALKLWIKGAKYKSIPAPPEPVSYDIMTPPQIAKNSQN